MKRKNGIQQSAKMEVVVWAMQHTSLLQGLSCSEAEAVIKKETGAVLPSSAVRDLYTAIKLPLRGRAKRKRPEGEQQPHSDERIDVLAYALRDLYVALGVEVPPRVTAICSIGEIASYRDAVLETVLASPALSSPAPPVASNGNGHKQKTLLG